MQILNFIKTILGLKNATSFDMKKYLIVGLGNIGEKYQDTRHNIGFNILDELAKQEDLVFENKKLGAIASFRFKGRTLILLKPSTYMNLSGKAVLYWMTKENIPLENILIIGDDLNLPFGTFRLKPKGSAGGHNGLNDINLRLNTMNYPRFRFGVGAEFSKGKQVDYVLGTWNHDQLDLLDQRIKKACDLIRSFATAGLQNTMNEYNGTI